jgi:methylenetetrahydrofolate--tRNA-(uracil-5-)-methyltransferase
MNVNFGLPAARRSADQKADLHAAAGGNEKTVAKRQAMSARALADLDRWISDHLRVQAAA